MPSVVSTETVRVSPGVEVTSHDESSATSVASVLCFFLPNSFAASAGAASRVRVMAAGAIAASRRRESVVS